MDKHRVLELRDKTASACAEIFGFPRLDRAAVKDSCDLLACERVIQLALSGAAAATRFKYFLCGALFRAPFSAGRYSRALPVHLFTYSKIGPPPGDMWDLVGYSAELAKRARLISVLISAHARHVGSRG